MAPKAGAVRAKPKGAAFKDKSKPADVRSSNINAAKGIFIIFLIKLNKFLSKWFKFNLQNIKILFLELEKFNF